MKYDEIKDQPSDESCLPSLDVIKQDKVEIEERKHSDKQTKAKHGEGIFRQSNIVQYVRCQECMAARLIYSTSSKLEIESAMPRLVRFIDANDYICGDALFGDDDASDLGTVFAIKRHLQAKLGGTSVVAYCNMPTQHAYYTRACFPTTCAWCEESSASELMSQDDHDDASLGSFQCDPICKFCAQTLKKQLPLFGTKIKGGGASTSN